MERSEVLARMKLELQLLEKFESVPRSAQEKAERRKRFIRASDELAPLLPDGDPLAASWEKSKSMFSAEADTLKTMACREKAAKDN